MTSPLSFPHSEIKFYADALTANVKASRCIVQITTKFAPFRPLLQEVLRRFPVMVRLFQALDTCRTIEIIDVPDMDRLCELTGVPFPFELQIISKSNARRCFYCCPSLLILVTGCIRLWSYEMMIYHGILSDTVDTTITKLELSFNAIQDAINKIQHTTSGHDTQAITK